MIQSLRPRVTDEEVVEKYYMCCPSSCFPASDVTEDKVQQTLKCPFVFDPISIEMESAENVVGIIWITFFFSLSLKKKLALEYRPRVYSNTRTIRV